MAQSVINDLDDGVDDGAREDKVEFKTGLEPLHKPVVANDELEIEVDWGGADGAPDAREAERDEAAAAKEEAAAEVVDDDLEEYSERVRKRIMRERNVTRKERDKNTELEQENERLRAQLAESTTKTFQQDVDKEIASARDKMRQARVDGDLDQEVEAADKLAELRVKRERPPRLPEPEVRREEVHQAKEDWLARNPWYEDDRYETQADTAARLSQKLIKQGKDPHQRSFWIALDQELEKVVVLPKAEKPRSPTQTVRAESPAKSKSTVTINAQDRQMARKFGLDLDNPDHLKAYAKEKARSA